ncbi:xylan esterase [Duganella sp. Leaf126]|uniref:bifunctional acetylxylan esterase/glucomannan deacetylase AxeC2 n=1 Tax=Duganella sp. Leaf126 TaxID=1736266 RepID=UPI0006F7D7FC|nr:bifunctional acetylxylan esterase/glucomannan deacetylase AxeC2 [Duganella sp. Leaf126]KQQ31863.1 xylan esterase [Duganella sp. Leaf126]
MATLPRLVALLLLACALPVTGGAGAAGAAATPGSSVAAADPHVARTGRGEVRADGAVHFAYPGVGFALAFDGTRASMTVEAGSDNSYIDVIVDGSARKVHLARGAQTLVLADGLARGAHRVEVVNRSEAWLGKATVQRFDTDGAWLPAPALPQRKLLILGDSVTCGEAIDRVPGTKKDASWWDARASYGMLLAHALQAQVQLVCAGGRGLVRSWDNRTDQLNLPDYYQLTVADRQQPVRWDQRLYHPDLILSAIGTNDFNVGIPERAHYVDTYVRLVRTLLDDHPHAKIVLTEGAMLKDERKAALVAYIAETVRRVADPRVQAVPSQTYPGDAQDAHPTRAQHAAMARDLAPQMRTIAGW